MTFRFYNTRRSRFHAGVLWSPAPSGHYELRYLVIVHCFLHCLSYDLPKRFCLQRSISYHLLPLPEFSYLVSTALPSISRPS